MRVWVRVCHVWGCGVRMVEREESPRCAPILHNPSIYALTSVSQSVHQHVSIDRDAHQSHPHPSVHPASQLKRSQPSINSHVHSHTEARTKKHSTRTAALRRTHTWSGRKADRQTARQVCGCERERANELRSTDPRGERTWPHSHSEDSQAAVGLLTNKTHDIRWPYQLAKWPAIKGKHITYRLRESTNIEHGQR